MDRDFERMHRHTSGNDLSFGGIVIDMACTSASVVSAAEHERYCRDTGAEYKIEKNSQGYVRVGNAKKTDQQARVKSLGIAKIRGYVATFDEVNEFYVYVVPNTDTPPLLSLQDFDKLGYELRTGSRTLWSRDRFNPEDNMYPRGPHKLSIYSDGRCVVKWSFSVDALFTDADLRRFHRNYGHSSTEKIMLLLREAYVDDLPGDTKQKLQGIGRESDACQRNNVEPRHFSVSMYYRGNTSTTPCLQMSLTLRMVLWFT